jgi:hypothetical protein
MKNAIITLIACFTLSKEQDLTAVSSLSVLLGMKR